MRTASRTPRCRRILAPQPTRQRGMPASLPQVFPVQRQPAQGQPLQRRCQPSRQHRDPVLATLAAAYGNDPGGEIDVLDAQGQRLADPHPGAIQKGRDQPRHPVHRIQRHANLLHGEHFGQPFRPPHRLSPSLQRPDLPTQHMPEQEQQGVQRLQMRTGRHLPSLHQVIEEAEGPGLAGGSHGIHPMEPPVAPYPVRIGGLGPAAETPRPTRRAQARQPVVVAFVPIPTRLTRSSSQLPRGGKPRAYRADATFP